MWASKPRISPFTFAFDRGLIPTRWAAPTTITSFITNGGADSPISGYGNLGSSAFLRPTNKSTTPFSPKLGSGTPVSASRETRWYPGVTSITRFLFPSLQKDTPRPAPFRGASSKRTPSLGLHNQRTWPEVASIATTLRVLPMFAYKTPSISIGVEGLLKSVVGPKLAVEKLQANSRSETLLASI